MKIELQQVVPLVLKDRLSRTTSDVWNKLLVFEQGEQIKIQAPSGTGKTTFVNILYQIRQDYLGDIFFNDQLLRNIHGDKLAVLRQSSISVVFQDLRLFPNLTAKENIELKRLLAPEYCNSSKIDTMAAELGITEILHQKASTCSYGEQQRIAIIRALVQPFKWLLLDEPFSHLDNSNTTKAAALIDRACKERGAGLIITDLEDDQHFNYNRKLQL